MCLVYFYFIYLSKIVLIDLIDHFNKSNIRTYWFIWPLTDLNIAVFL